jgi:hypothetical protein
MLSGVMGQVNEEAGQHMPANRNRATGEVPAGILPSHEGEGNG